jgi:uncharacterized secreted protein with C-terminal beta-propeller domain
MEADMRATLRRTPVLIVLVAAGTLGSCSWFKKNVEGNCTDCNASKTLSGDEPLADPDLVSPTNLTGDLRTFSNCDQAKEYIVKRSVALVRHQTDEMMKYYRKPAPGDYASPDVSSVQAEKATTNDAATPAAASAETGAAETSGPESHTGTNNQVDGVEESDFVQNDGKHIFQIAGKSVKVLKSWPAESLDLAGSVEFKGFPFQLLLAGDKLVVLVRPLASASTSTQLPGADQGIASSGIAPVNPGFALDYSTVEVHVLDVSEAATPKELDVYRLDGSFHAARGIGNSIRLVLEAPVHFPEDINMWVSPYDASYEKLSVDEVKSELAEKITDIEGKLNEAPINDLLGTDRLVRVQTDGSEERISDLGSCEYVHAPSVSAEIAITRVASLNLDSGKLTQTVLLSNTQNQYMSMDSLYLVSQYYWWAQDNQDSDWSFIHKFSLESPEYAAYKGSGGLPGYIASQFSLDEFDGALRVATTIRNREPVNPENINSKTLAWGAWQQTNKVFVLEESSGKLEIVGQTDGIGDNESIYGARFYGPRAFIITFRQTDPLYTVDLSDKTDPKVVGELKMPGYSSYLHMIDDDHILAIGRDPGNWWGGAPKISIFDVSDMADPKEVQKLVLGGSDWTQAEWDHHAFTYYPEKKLLGLPITGYGDATPGVSEWWKTYRSALAVFTIDAAKGISQVGELDMTDIYQDPTERDAGWWFGGATVARSIFAEDYVYAISNLGVRVAKSNSPGTVAAEVQYDCKDGCPDYWPGYY